MDFWKDLEAFTTTDERAGRCVTNYERGLLTLEEAIRGIEEFYHDKDFVFFVEVKEKRRGGKWQTYSGPVKYRYDAETVANEAAARNELSINGHPLVYRIVSRLRSSVYMTA